MQKSFFNLIFFSFFILNSYSLFAQKFVLDSTFQLHFDIRNRGNSGDVEDIWENSKNGKILFTGNFEFNVTNPFEQHIGTTIINRDGSRDFSYKGGGGDGLRIYPLGDSVFVINGHVIFAIDSTGTKRMQNWQTRVRFESVRCKSGIEPYFFDDGSMLLGNSGCDIIVPPDTFPGRYIVKIDPSGKWDSTFVKDANSPPPGFMTYDSNRLFIYGAPWRFTEYDGITVNGLCRIFDDGSLDTTFKTPLLSDTISILNPSLLWIDYVYPDGRFIAVGNFYLKDSSNSHQIMRFHADGSLDTSFMNFFGAEDTSRWGYPWIETVAPLPDGGFLVGGSFNKYQGVKYNNIAKIDSNGRLDPSFNIGRGPEADTNAFKNASSRSSVDIIKVSEFGGIYVGGGFYKWDGLACQNLVRLVEDNTTGLKSTKNTKNALKLYPNPATDQLMISAERPIVNYRLSDLTGRTVLLNESAMAQYKLALNTSRLKAGIYIISVQIDRGELISQKFIKK